MSGPGTKLRDPFLLARLFAAAAVVVVAAAVAGVWVGLPLWAPVLAAAIGVVCAANAHQAAATVRGRRRIARSLRRVDRPRNVVLVLDRGRLERDLQAVRDDWSVKAPPPAELQLVDGGQQ